MDIIDKSIKLNKRIYINNREDFLNLMKLAESKGYLWFSGTKPIKFFNLNKEKLPLAIRFVIYKDVKIIGASPDVKKFSCIKYSENMKRGNILW